MEKSETEPRKSEKELEKERKLREKDQKKEEKEQAKCMKFFVFIELIYIYIVHKVRAEGKAKAQKGMQYLIIEKYIGI